MNIMEHVSLLHVGTSSGYMPRNGISGSSGSTMFNILRNCQTDFQSGETIILRKGRNLTIFLFYYITHSYLGPGYFLVDMSSSLSFLGSFCHEKNHY